MRIGCIGDVHGELQRLEGVADFLAGNTPDLVLLVGDFIPGRVGRDRWRELAELVGRSLELLRPVGAPVLLVPGNHDPPRCEFPENIDGRAVEAAGLRVAGIGGSGPHHFGFPYEWGEDDIRSRRLGAADILLSHAPPARTALDRLYDGRHVGSEAVRERAKDARILVCGHVHESAGVERVDGCACYNVGSLGEPYGRAQAGVVSLGEGEVRVEHWGRAGPGSPWGREWARVLDDAGRESSG